MKKRKKTLQRFLLNIALFANYTDLIFRVEKVLARKPEKLQLDIVGAGEIAADTALLFRSVLLNRSAKTHLVTNARSSLQGGSVLIWLMGDTRLIREDAKLFFRRPESDSDDEGDEWKKEERETESDSSPAQTDLEEADHVQVLQHINSFLPVKELAGRTIDVPALRQFGLVENEKMDEFLADAFARNDPAAVASRGPAAKAAPASVSGSGHGPDEIQKTE